jgi:hypothetical protein
VMMLVDWARAAGAQSVAVRIERTRAGAYRRQFTCVLCIIN